METREGPVLRRIVATWPGACRTCHRRFQAGARVLWEPPPPGSDLCGRTFHAACGWSPGPFLRRLERRWGPIDPWGRDRPDGGEDGDDPADDPWGELGDPAGW